MQDQLAQMMKDKDKPTKTYMLDALCPFPFDKNLDMPPFPRGVELPSMTSTSKLLTPKIT